MSFASRIGFNAARSAPAERSSADRSKNESPAFPQSQGGNGVRGGLTLVLGKVGVDRSDVQTDLRVRFRVVIG
jgi:hypothetical protein